MTRTRVTVAIALASLAACSPVRFTCTELATGDTYRAQELTDPLGKTAGYRMQDRNNIQFEIGKAESRDWRCIRERGE